MSGYRRTKNSKGNQPLAKRYSFFTDEQQQYFESCDIKLRSYIESRAQGRTKALSYQMAGYRASNAKQAAQVLEKRNPLALELIKIMQDQLKAVQLFKEGGSTERDIIACAKQKDVANLLEKLNNVDPESAQSILFYKDVASGKIRTTKTVRTFNAEGMLIKTTEEEINDVNLRMLAQKKVDEWCGFSTSALRVAAEKPENLTINIIDCGMDENERDARDNCSLMKEIEEENKDVNNDNSDDTIDFKKEVID